MVDLDWIFQLGPEFVYYLSHTHRQTTSFRFPMRFVASTDFSHRFDGRGVNWAPNFRTEIRLGKNYGELTTRLEFEFLSKEMSQYFYNVPQESVTATRPYYEAKPGFAETIIGLTYSNSSFMPWSFFISGNVYLLSDNENRESPLHFRSLNYSLFGALIYFF